MYVCIPTQIWKHTYHMHMSTSAFSPSDELCIFVFVNACVSKVGKWEIVSVSSQWSVQQKVRNNLTLPGSRDEATAEQM